MLDQQAAQQSITVLFPTIPLAGHRLMQHVSLDTKPVGKGTFAEVYRATIKPVYNDAGVDIHPQSGYEVAVKIIDKEKMRFDIDRLRAEVALLQRIRHPYIVDFYNIFEEPTKVALVMEFLHGGELFQRLRTSKPHGFHENIAKIITRRLVEALAYLHRENIIHRDLKPENILFKTNTNDFEVKLTDFGLAKLVTDDVVAKTACGSPFYVAPEVLHVQKTGAYTSAVDMWSLGVITYVILCGFAPFHHDQPPELFKLILAGTFTFPTDYWRGVSQEAKDFISALIVVDPRSRMTARDALNHLWLKDVDPDPLARKHPPPAPAPSTPPAGPAATPTLPSTTEVAEDSRPN